MSFMTHLECGLCNKRLEADRAWNLCRGSRQPAEDRESRP